MKVWERSRCQDILAEEQYTGVCSIAVSTALLVGAGIAAAGGVASSVIGSKAASHAADTQAQAAEYAADLQHQQYEQTRTDQLPWLEQGKVSLAQIAKGLELGGQFSTPFDKTFSAPTEAEARATPGYQFTKDEGEKSVLHGLSAGGGAFTGNTLTALDRYGTGLADSTYNNVFNRALSTYQTQYNQYNTDQTNLYNKLAGVSGLGQQTGTQLGVLGAQSAAQQGSLLTDAAAAKAAGTIGSANAITGGINQVANSASGYLTLTSLLNGQARSPYPNVYNTAGVDPSYTGTQLSTYQPPPSLVANSPVPAPTYFDPFGV